MSGSTRIINPVGGNKTRVNTLAPQIGIVKDNVDVENMGRLKVWIKGSNTLEDDPAGWITCSYASPFAGASDTAILGNSVENYDDTQDSYGFWAVPPDNNNLVIVIFVNGDIKQAFWVACLYQKDMNYMVPGIGEGLSYQTSKYGNSVPVAEYNKLGTKSDRRPAYTPLADGLSQQGLLGDDLRGAGSSSSRRESPSNTYGMKTPGGQHFVLDDGVGSELIRLRTKSGAQILISETVGNIYIISRDGNNWFELGNDGNVDIYAGAGFNVYARGDINMRSGGSINMEAAKDFNLKTGGSVNVDSGKLVNLKSVEDCNVETSAAFNLSCGTINMLAEQNNVSIRSGGEGSNSGFVMTPGGDMNFNMAGNLNMRVNGNFTQQVHGNIQTWQAGSGGVTKDGGSHAESVDNTAPPVPQQPTAPRKPDKIATNQQSLKGADKKEAPATTVCSRVPDAEPWAGHLAARTGTRDRVDEGASGASKGSVTDNASEPLHVVGSPTKGMKPGVYTPRGYDKKGSPVYEYSGPTTALLDVNKLTTSDAGIDFITKFEGRSLKKYPDAAGFSIGYGHFITPNDPPDVQTGPISDATAIKLLQGDLRRFENAVRNHVKVPLTQSQFDALISFSFNVGDGAFIKSTLLKELNNGNYSEVPNQLMRWVNSGGKPILVHRRRAEGLMFSRPASTTDNS